MLANKYRPKTFDEVIGQEVSKTLIQNQLKSKNYSNSIFVGNSGCGKTTCAKLVASAIDGEIYEYDCASRNGVADVKAIIEQARVPSILKPYKVYILDECQTLSSAAWSSMLIALEEKIPNVVFIFCTTDPQKIPNTIFSRVQRYDFGPIPDSMIIDRLKFVCQEESISIEDEPLSLIAESAEGSMRQALTNLDKCVTFGKLDVVSVRRVLNFVGGKIFDALYDAVVAKDIDKIVELVELTFMKGYEMHQFTRRFLEYAMKRKNIQLVDLLLETWNDIKYDDSPKTLIIARLMTYGGDVK